LALPYKGEEGAGAADLIAVGGPPYNIQLADIGDGLEGLEAGLLGPGRQREQVLPGVLHRYELSNLMFSTSVVDQDSIESRSGSSISSESRSGSKVLMTNYHLYVKIWLYR
jgi:hypothetical protein